MDMSTLVIIWIIVLVVENIFGKKKKAPPPTPTESTDGSNPSFPNEDVVIFQDEQKAAEVREVGFTEPYGRQKISSPKVESEVNANSTDKKNSNLPLNLTAESAMNAIILSEVLGKPKALRRR